MKKKIFIICVFAALILFTAICTIVSAVDSYRYDMDPANGVDIFEGFGAVFIAIIGGFIVLYELDLFGAVYYFFTKPKSLKKNILIVLSNLILPIIFFSKNLIEIGRSCFPSVFKAPFEESILIIGLLLIYFALKIVYFTICCCEKEYTPLYSK